MSQRLFGTCKLLGEGNRPEENQNQKQKIK